MLTHIDTAQTISKLTHTASNSQHNFERVAVCGSGIHDSCVGHYLVTSSAAACSIFQMQQDQAGACKALRKLTTSCSLLVNHFKLQQDKSLTKESSGKDCQYY